MATKTTGKRGNTEGSIYQRRKDGRYCAAVTFHDEEGKLRRKTAYGATREEVAGKLTGLLGDVQKGLPVGDDRQLLRDYLSRWLENVVRPGSKESTALMYEKDIRLHIVPTLGKIPLTKLAPEHLERLYATKLKEGLAPSTVIHIHRVLSQALTKAATQNTIPRNVARLVTPPRRPRAEVQALTFDQARALRDAAAGHRLEAFIVTGIGLGLRRGELLALRWDDIDFEGGTLAVRRALSKVKGQRGVRAGWVVAEPKTPASNRVVKMPAFVAEALKAHRTRQLETRLASAVWVEPSLVFTTDVGTMLDGRSVLREFKELLAAAEVPESFTIHSLRHSAASFMLSLGVQPKVVQELLGHSRIATTMDVYSHLMPHMQADAAEKMDRKWAASQ